MYWQQQFPYSAVGSAPRQTTTTSLLFGGGREGEQLQLRVRIVVVRAPPPPNYYYFFGASALEMKSAVPGLRQGRGGAWDHRRCGT